MISPKTRDLATVAPVGAYGGGADHDMWQVGLSFNCNNPAFCGPDLGGFWGWVEFDRSADGTQTWGDAELAGCTHAVGGGGFAGAFHVSVEIESWTIGAGSGGPQTFFVTGEETDSFRGDKVTFDITNLDTGIPAIPGHDSTSESPGLRPTTRRRLADPGRVPAREVAAVRARRSV